MYDQSELKESEKMYYIYVKQHGKPAYVISYDVPQSELEAQVKLTREGFPDSIVHVSCVYEMPYLSYLPKSTETGIHAETEQADGTINDQIARNTARLQARSHYKPVLAEDDDYQFSVFMLILAQVHHALMTAKLEIGLVLEMKNCSLIIEQEMQAAGFVLKEMNG